MCKRYPCSVILLKSVLLFCLTSVLFSCGNGDVHKENGSIGPEDENSIFHLSSTWNTQDSAQIKLRDLRGKVLVMVMIYTSCKAACPRLVADMRDIESQIPEKHLPDLNFVLISIDPATDKPGRLKRFAIANKMDAPHWIFLQGSVSDTREFANVMSVKYKEISPIDFSHSNIISVINRKGVLVFQQEGLGVNNKETIAKIIETVKQ